MFGLTAIGGSDTAMALQFTLPSAYRLVGTRSWGSRHGVTLAPASGASGTREFLWLRPGFHVTLSQVAHQTAGTELYSGGDQIKIHVRLLGGSAVGQPGGAHDLIDPLSVNLLRQPTGTAKEERFAANVRERSVTLCCSRDFLIDEVGLASLPRLGGPLGDVVDGRTGTFHLTRHPLGAATRALAESLLDLSADTPLRALQVEARALELLLDILGVGSPDRTAPGGGPGRLDRIRQHIETHLDSQFDVRQLARQFGFSESNLARRFKEAYGLPVSDYIGLARSRRALHLLETTDLSITEVAFEVGYNHPSNFSTAFKRHFGKSPRAVRRPG